MEKWNSETQREKRTSPGEIKGLRKKLRMSQRKFARRLGVSHNLIWYWENGKKSPSRDFSEKLALLAKEADNSEVDRVDKKGVDSEKVGVDNSGVDSQKVDSQRVDSQKVDTSKVDSQVDRVDNHTMQNVNPDEASKYAVNPSSTMRNAGGQREEVSVGPTAVGPTDQNLTENLTDNNRNLTENLTDGMEWKPDEIKGLRKKLSLSQRQFAKRLGVKRLTIARWESGNMKPNPERLAMLKRLANDTNVSLHDTKHDTNDTKNVSSHDTNDTTWRERLHYRVYKNDTKSSENVSRGVDDLDDQVVDDPTMQKDDHDEASKNNDDHVTTMRIAQMTTMRKSSDDLQGDDQKSDDLQNVSSSVDTNSENVESELEIVSTEQELDTNSQKVSSEVDTKSETGYKVDTKLDTKNKIVSNELDTTSELDTKIVSSEDTLDTKNVKSNQENVSSGNVESESVASEDVASENVKDETPHAFKGRKCALSSQGVVLAEHALEYFEKRRWAIHPLVPRDKKPVCDNWNRWSHELPTREQIENWWKENPSYNIGLVTGEASKVVVLDIDLQHNPNAIVELESIAGSGIHKKIVCPYVHTPGGGLHAYFTYPEGANIGCSSIGIEGIDTRGNGGNIVLPPSIHPNGGVYKWHLPLEDRDLPPLPDAVVARLDKDRPAPKPPKVNVKLNPNDLLSVMMDRCAFCREFTPNTGDMHEELWYRWLTQMVCYDGGDKLAYELSSGSPKFDDKTTQAKIRHAQEVVAKGLAPYTCEEIIGCEGWKSEECQSCIAHPSRRNASPAGLPYILRSIEVEKIRAGIYDEVAVDTTKDEPIPDEVLDEMAEKEKEKKQPTAWVTEPIDESEIDTTPSISIPVLPETVWRGTFADYRALMSPTTEASDAYHFAGFFAIVGALLGRSVFMYYGGRIYPNFFTVIEGRTGISRKSTALSQATETLKAVDSTVLIRRGLSTSEGLINLLKAPTAEELEEYAEQLAAYQEGRISIEPVQPPPVFAHEGRRLLVAMDEFALLLKKAKQEFSSGLIQTLTDAYDMKGSLDNPTKERPMSALNTCVSMVGLTTKAWLERSLDYDDLLGGFVNRFVFFVGEPKASIPLPPEPDAQLWNRIKIHLNNVRQGNHTFALKEKSSIQYRLSEEAKTVWEDFYNPWRERQLTSDNEMEVCLFQRLPNHAMKLALTCAVLEDKGGTRQISTDQLNAGIDFANYAEQSYKYLFHSFGFSRRSRVEATIEEKLSTQRMTKNELRRAISTAINTRELNESILDLMKIGRLREISIYEKDAIGRKRRKSVLVLLKG